MKENADMLPISCRMRNRVSAYESAESVGKGKDDWCTKLSGFCLSGCSPGF